MNSVWYNLLHTSQYVERHQSIFTSKVEDIRPSVIVECAFYWTYWDVIILTFLFSCGY